MSEKTITKKAGLIEGLPSSYDTNYVLKSNKKCSLCDEEVISEDIRSGDIIYVDHYDFVHRDCLVKNNIEYTHSREGDYNSPVSLKKKSF